MNHHKESVRHFLVLISCLQWSSRRATCAFLPDRENKLTEFGQPCNRIDTLDEVQIPPFTALSISSRLRNILQLASVLFLATTLAQAAAEYSYDEVAGIPSLVIISGYTGSGSAISIPTSLEGKTVVGIGAGAFYNNSTLTHVNLHSGIISIGIGAFERCTSLTSITIPDSVISIGSGAFAGCTSLTSVPSGLKNISDEIFYGCTGLTSVTIAPGVTSIGDRAFAVCTAITSVTMPPSVTSVGDGAFSHCTQLATLVIESGAIGNEAFYGCTALTSLTIKNGATSIGDYAFFGCRLLPSVVIPSSATKIGDYAFHGCNLLTGSLTIPGNVKSIGEYAFFNTALTRIVIEDGPTSIGDYAFAQCYNIASATIAGSVTSIGHFAFDHSYSMTSLTIQTGVASIGDSAFKGCAGLTDVRIPASMTSIGNNAFLNCGSLIYAFFLGHAPLMGTDVFLDARGDFAVYCRLESAGFGFALPTWLGYPRKFLPIAQTITFEFLENITLGEEPSEIRATSSSNLPVAIVVLEGPAEFVDHRLVVTGKGRVVIHASQAGDEIYAPAVSVARSFMVSELNYQDSDLVGAWTLGADTVIIFQNNGTYYHMERVTADESAESGFETGHYTWNPATGALTIITNSDKNGESGLSHLEGAAKITINGNNLTLTIAGEGSYSLSRVQSSTVSLVGAWRLGAGQQSTAIITFLPNGTYFHVERGTADESGQSGIEFGRYTWNSATRAFTTTTTFDQNGEWGLSHSSSAQTVNVTENILTLADAGEGSVSFTRITPDYKPQTITFAQPLARVFGAAPFSLAATATSRLPVSFELVSGPAAIGPDGKTLTLLGAGTVTVRAFQPGNDTFAPAVPVLRSIVVNKATQTITFALAPAKIALGAAAPTLAGTATSGLPVEFSVVSGPASLQETDGGAVLRPTAPGTIKIRAEQHGNDNYQSARAIERTLLVTGPVLILGDLRHTYDSTPRAVTITGIPEGFEDHLVVTYFAPGTYPLSENPPKDAGTYAVIATLGSVKKTGSLVITKAPLSVLAEDATRPVAAANPAFTLTYEGFLGDDTQSGLDRLPLPATKATLQSPAGVYPISFTGGLDNNYAFASAPEPGQLTVQGFGGTYEALLFDGDATPVGKLTLIVPANALTFTGTLTLAREAKVVPIKNLLTAPLVATLDASSASATWTRNVVGFDTLSLALTVSADGTLAGSLDRNGEPFADLADGARVVVFAKGQSAPGAGANTLALHPAYNLFADGPLPGGSGHATAPIAAATGVLTVKGSVADGLPLTASLKPTLTGYHLWTNPYGTRLDSFLAGRLALQDHPDQIRFKNRSYIPSDEGLLIWKKAGLLGTAKTPDKSYRTGFGPLGLRVSLDPWLPPATKATPTIPAGTLAQRLGLAAAPALAAPFGIDYFIGDGAPITEPQINTLPAALNLAATGQPVPPADNPAKFALKLTPATGAFSGSFMLSDQVVPPPAKPVTRKVTFSGILRQAPAGESPGSSLIGAGFFLVPGFAKTDEQPSGEIRFTAPGGP